MLDLRLKIPPTVLAVVIAVAMWLVARASPGLTVDIAGRRAAATALAVMGAVIAFLAGARLFHAKTTVLPMRPERAATLVTGGIYRRTRNPMYLGLAILLVAWAVELGSAPALGVIVVFVAYLNWSQIRPEEAALERRFGREYVAYRSRVRRWI